jgi:methyltransferase-like protein
LCYVLLISFNDRWQLNHKFGISWPAAVSNEVTMHRAHHSVLILRYFKQQTCTKALNDGMMSLVAHAALTASSTWNHPLTPAPASLR